MILILEFLAAWLACSLAFGYAWQALGGPVSAGVVMIFGVIAAVFLLAFAEAAVEKWRSWRR